MNQCPFCEDILNNGEQITRLTEKGCTSIRVAADQRNEQVTVKSGQNVHTVCRQQFTNKNVLKKDVTPKKTDQLKRREIELRSPQTKFSFKEQCLFCTQRVILENKKSKLNDAFAVRTVELGDTLIKKCEERGKTDEWSSSVMARLMMVSDLHAADAAYHQLCSVNFRTGKQIPNRFITSETTPHVKQGRPEDPEQANAFLEVVDYIVKNEDEQISLVNLVDLMKSLCGDKAFRSNYMKKKILDYFGDSVYIADMNGTENIVMFRQTASNILKKYYNKEKKTEVEEKTAIIEAAAQLVRSEIKSMPNIKMFYPTKDDVSSLLNNINFVPETLRFFLRSVTGLKEDTIKIASIGQSIVQATRPKSILAPLQIGLGIQCHHHYASKFLIDTLYRLGFSSSYKEVQLFEANAAKQHASDQHTLPSGHFVQFVADNVDHNLRTLDGHNTFHGMGMLSGFSPAVMNERRIRRQYVNTNEITELGRINIMPYCTPGEISMDNFRSINLPETYINERHPIHLFPNLVWCLRSPTPGWSGFMQMVEDGPHPGKSSFTFLPMIDLNPSDMSCIYSTLHYINNLARKYNVTPTLTFDQPLYWKAKIIVANERDDISNIFLRLGGFHIELSFLGSMGHLMGGSGLKELLECVYAPNAVTHMISGKAVSRAIRGHMLVDKVLHALVIERIYGVTVTDEDFRSENGETNNITALPSGDLREIVELYDRIQVSNSLNTLDNSTVLKRIQRNIEKEKSNLRKCRTASLWFMYMDMVMLLREFITAERTGNWKAHIHTLQKMLPYFAASGHNNYTKSVNLYLQDAVNLTTSKPEVFKFFSNGHHVLRRSDRYWAGLSTDLIIEQTLMRSCKTTGGMTRGRGMTEHQRAHWLLSMPACAEINVAMQDLLGIDFQTSDQHKECSVARMARDELDSQKMLSFLKTRNPFDDIESLRNIESGVLASERVNADSSLELGNRIIETMENQCPLTYTFKRTRQAVTLAADTHTLKIDGENVHIDPQLLFQRLLTAANVQDEPLKLFDYELCTYPPSLFDDNGLMRLAKKSALADALWGLCNITDISLPTSPIQYVLDGGSLIHKIPWSSGCSFQYICNSYVGYLRKRYTTTTIVFDGYPACSTKDSTHRRRTHGIIGRSVLFSPETILRSKKEQFLSNTENKVNFIKMLQNILEENGYSTFVADDDADTLIVKTAIEKAKDTCTVLIGEDTDLLVLLCHLTPMDSNNIFFKSEQKQTANKPVRIWDIHKTKAALGQSLCNLLPVIHALTGCDTTSRLHSIGKNIALKKATKNESLRQYLEVFCAQSSQDDIVKAGEGAISALYNGMPHEGLNLLRFRMFTSKTASSKTSAVLVTSLPPTSNAAKYHSLRTYQQVQMWMNNCYLDPTEWGWKRIEDQLIPIKTSQPVAPEYLLKVIRCSCKGSCDTKRCSCRKHGMNCTMACTECNGVSCLNSSPIDNEDDEDELEQ